MKRKAKKKQKKRAASSVKAERKLTAMQQRFCEEYLVDLSQRAAAIRAGYSAKSVDAQGSQLMKNPKVAAKVIELMAARSERTGIDADYVLRQAVKLHERCMQEIEPFTDRKGEHVFVVEQDEDGETARRPLYVFDARGAAQSLKMVGEHAGVRAFVRRHEHTGKDGKPIETEGKILVEFVSPGEEGGS